jgi:hypothetical protein
MFQKTLMAIAVASLVTSAFAAVSADEAKQLGTTLTAVGAEKAGNKEGTIPEYTGGLKDIPSSFKKGSGIRPSPFENDKPRLVIDAKNAAQHADKLTEGSKELLKRYPTMRLDVYPTQRVVALPAKVLANTAKNATGAKSVNNGLGVEGMLPGVPFPIPKTGAEAMWNHLTVYRGAAYNQKYENWNVDAAGVASLATAGNLTNEFPLYDPKRSDTVAKESDPYFKLKLHYTGPARRAGEALMAIDSVNAIRAAAPCLAIPAGTAPRQARARPVVRHAQRGHRGHVDVLRRVRLQRRAGPVRLEARGQEGDVRSVQRLQAHVRQGPEARVVRQPRQSRIHALGTASRVGRGRIAEAGTAGPLQQARVLHRRRQLGRARRRPVRRQGAALSLDLRQHDVQLRRERAERG